MHVISTECLLDQCMVCYDKLHNREVNVIRFRKGRGKLRRGKVQ